MPYKFNGKEFDEETGLYYYGARYMNPVTSLWYGVDPLAEKYVSKERPTWMLSFLTEQRVVLRLPSSLIVDHMVMAYP